MLKDKSMQDALLQQNWEKTQYRAADWLSDHAVKKDNVMPRTGKVVRSSYVTG
ncbi:MAG TPA: hypothetical protein PLN01_10555 [Spirochaetota bacterium]|nr:hypothetical protein [Spirochaetota bacterium]